MLRVQRIGRISMKLSQTRFRILSLLISTAMAVLTAFYRANLLKTSADMETLQLLEGQSLNWLYILIVVAGVVLLLLSVIFKAAQQSPPRKMGVAMKSVAAISSFLFILAGIVVLVENSANLTIVPLINAVFLLVCGACGLLQLKNSAQAGLLSLFPLCYLCFYLLVLYRQNASNPIIYSFALEIITAVILMLAIYRTCSNWFERSKPATQLFFTSISFYMAIMTQLSHYLLPAYFNQIKGVCLSSTLLQLAVLLLLLKHLFYPLQKPAQPEEITEKEE